MGDLIKRHPVTAALAALALLLLVVAGVETGWGTRLRPTVPAGAPVRTAAVEAKLLPPVIAIPAEQAFPETGSRPLFTPTRRPAPPVASAGSLQRGQYVLHGVTIVGDLRIALLKEKSSGRTLRAEKGREFNGITVAEVERDKVTLRVGEDVEVLALTVQKGGHPGVSAVPAGPFSAPAPASVPGAPSAASSARPGTPGIPPQPGTAGTSAPPKPSSAPAAGAPGPGTRSEPPAVGSASASPPSQTPEAILERRRARRLPQTPQ